MRNTPSRRSIVATLVLVFLFITTGFAIQPSQKRSSVSTWRFERETAAWLGGVSAPSAEASVTTDRSDYRPARSCTSRAAVLDPAKLYGSRSIT
jgi:hypothetical protein